MSDHPQPDQMGHGYGETYEQHQAHAHPPPVQHRGLSHKGEQILFYAFALPSWALEIVACIFGSYYDSSDTRFIATVTPFLVLSAAAWLQTAVGMMQRASWVRDESNLADRRRYLYFAVRLNRLMLPTAVFAFATFVVGYVRRNNTHDLGNWLIFLIVFICNVVGSVMNAYNNITWESERLEYEEGQTPYGNTLLACLGITTQPRKAAAFQD